MKLLNMWAMCDGVPVEGLSYRYVGEIIAEDDHTVLLRLECEGSPDKTVLLSKAEMRTVISREGFQSGFTFFKTRADMEAYVGWVYTTPDSTSRPLVVGEAVH